MGDLINTASSHDRQGDREWGLRHANPNHPPNGTEDFIETHHERSSRVVVVPVGAGTIRGGPGGGMRTPVLMRFASRGSVAARERGTENTGTATALPRQTLQDWNRNGSNVPAVALVPKFVL